MLVSLRSGNSLISFRRELVENLKLLAPILSEASSKRSRSQCATFDFADLDSFNRLKVSLGNKLRPEKKTLPNGALLTTCDTLGGPFIYNRKLVKLANPLAPSANIYRTVTIEGGRLGEAVNYYAEYIYDDINYTLSSENGYNIFQAFEVNSLEEVNENLVINKEEYTFESIIKDKAKFITKLKTMLNNRVSIKLKVLSLIPDPNIEFNVFPSEEIKANPEDTFNIFINCTKYYGLHHSTESKGGGVKTSLWHVPCIVYIEGIFIVADNAINYLSYYPDQIDQGSRRITLLPKAYYKYKCQKVIRSQEKGNSIKTMWNLLLLISLENGEVRKQFLPNIFNILSHPAIEVCSLRKVASTLKDLIFAYCETNTEVFKITANNIFKGYKEEMRNLYGSGFAAEAICHRVFIETLLRKITCERNELLFNNLSASILETLSCTSECIGNSIATQICRMDKVLLEAVDYILKKANNPKAGVNIFKMAGLLEGKRPRQIVDILAEIAKNSKTKAYPIGMEEEYIIMQYLVDMDVYENITTLLKDIIYGPIYPNPLSNIEYSFQLLASKYSIWQLPNEDIVRLDFTKVMPSTQPPYHMFIVDVPELINKNLPRCMGKKEVLEVCSSINLGYFKKLFECLEFPKELIQKETNFNIMPILSVVGDSLFNAQHRMKVFASSWEVCYDLLFLGTVMELAKKSFIDIIIKYAKYLSTVSVMLGIYSVNDNGSLVLSLADIFDESATERNINLLLSIYSNEYP